MSKLIYLPNEEQSEKLIVNAWSDFEKKLNESNMAIGDENVRILIRDMFVAGYSYGHNDCLDIIRSQMEIDTEVAKLTKGE